MTRRRNIVPLGQDHSGETHERPDADAESQPEYFEAEEDWVVEEEPYIEVRRSGRAWIIPLVALALLAGWTAAFVAARMGAIGGGITFQQGIDLLIAWSMPAALIVAGWLLALRHSRVEAGRFADSAASLRAESAALEDRLGRINSELSIAREFLTAQGRDLESLGRIASERLGEHAGRLQTLVGENGERVEQLHTVSSAALDNMEKLRGQLPVVTNAARDLTNTIGQAGDGARAQIGRLEEGFAKVGESGDASALKIDAMRERVAAVLGEFERSADHLGTFAAERFAALEAEAAALRERLDQQEVAALATVRSRADEIERRLEGMQDRLAEVEGNALTALRERLTGLDDESGHLVARLREAEEAAIAAWRERIGEIGREAADVIESIDAGSSDASAQWRGRLSDIRNEADAIFARLDEASGQSLDGVGARVAALSGEISRLHGDLSRQGSEIEEQIAGRISRSEDAGQAMAAKLVEALAAVDSEINARRREQDELGQQSTDRIAASLADLDDAIDQRRRRQEELGAQITRHADAIAERLDEYGGRMETVANHAREAENGISSGLAALAQRLLESREALAGTDKAVADLTDNAIRLLEVIEGAARHSREALPHSLTEAEGRLDGFSERVDGINAAVEKASESGRALDEALAHSRETTRIALGEIESLHDTLDARGSGHREQLEGLRQVLTEARAESEQMAHAAEETLSGALAELAQASRQAVADIEGTSSDALKALAERLAEQSRDTVRVALEESTSGALEGLDEAVERATQAARGAADDLRAELARVDEITGHLEHRIADARRRAEEEIDDHFGKRVAQITESLNSTAIDIDKVLSAEVSDSAWQAYLKGERGIFTRRAVRLLDSGDARAVSEHYEADAEFREHVNRYIHDFEAMLRNLLATRDGNALAMTVLSSDMGKLYVAMAQAIERLRR